jgi:trimeric autotransporter adhesin
MALPRAYFCFLVQICCIAGFPQRSLGQSYTISTFAGGGLLNGIPGTSTHLSDGPNSVAVDLSGNIFFSNGGVCVLRLDAVTGLLTTVAGNGTPGYSGDGGPATSAQLDAGGVAVDLEGNLYIASGPVVRKVADGVITTVAGNGNGGYTGDGGPATSAGLSASAVSVDSAGNLYILDSDDLVVRKVSNGVITTVAGNGTSGYTGDGGPATSALGLNAYSMTVDAAGNLYIAVYLSTPVVRRVANGVVTTIAGGGGSPPDNIPATSASLSEPSGLAVDSSGNLYIADNTALVITKVANGLITTIAGTGSSRGSSANGVLATSAVVAPSSLAVDSAGSSVYIGETSLNGDIRKITNGIIITVAGDGNYVGDNGPAVNAQLFEPDGVAVDTAGNVYITDGDCLVRKVTAGVITTVAGNGTCGYSGDHGPATSAQLAPDGVAVDSAGNLYIVGGCVVRKVTNGVITTFAGIGTFEAVPGEACGYTTSGDGGPAAAAQLDAPTSVAVDLAGNVYIADQYNSVIRKVTKGVITTIAGTGNLTYGYSGDGGPATSAQLFQPSGVAVDAEGDVYIADQGNDVIRKVTNGVITTIAGNGTEGYSGDGGPATSAQLFGPCSVAVDAAGAVYIVDAGNAVIRKVTNGIITTVAGNGTFGYSGDGSLATTAELYPDEGAGVAVDSAGKLYIADTSNNRVRLASPMLPTLTVTKTHPHNFTQGDTSDTYTITVSNSGTIPVSTAVTVVDTLPTGLTATALSGASGSGWNCTLASLTCSGAGGIAAGASYPLTLTVAVAGNAPASVVNQVSVSLGGALVASATDPTTIYAPASCDIDNSGGVNVSDVQHIINEALGNAAPVNDLNNDGVVNIVDVQIVINAALGLGCLGS